MPEINLPTKSTQDRIETKVDNITTILPKMGKTLRKKQYLTSGTFSVPAGVTEVYITAAGGGGSGGGSFSTDMGVSGGTTSFGSLLSLSGGGAGTSSGASGSGGGGGPSGGGIRGGNGQGGSKTVPPTSIGATSRGGNGGSSGQYQGGIGERREAGLSYNQNHPMPGTMGSGGGGSVAYDTNDAYCGGGGGGAMFVIDKPVAVTPGTNITVTIGNGGTTTHRGANGGNGYMFIEWWE